MRRMIAVMAVALFVAACSPSAASSAGAPSPVVGGVPSDPCTLLSSAEVSTAAGFTVGAGARPAANNGFTCHWDGPADVGGNPQSIELTLDPGAVQYNVVKGSPVPGLGLEANVLPLVGQLNVRLASTAFSVFALMPSATQLAVETALAKLVIPRLGG